MRLRILNEEEIDSLYGLPRFTQEARTEYFALSDSEKTALDQFHSLKSKLFFVLQLGYFKASRVFFVFGLRDAEEDAAYLVETRFPYFEDRDATIAKGTRLKQQRLILELCDYRNFDREAQKKLQAKARQVATVCGKPVYVFRELMHSLSEQRIVAPGYSTMQDIVGGALTYEQRRLAGIAQVNVYPSARKDLERLLEDRQGLHEITLLKRDPRDFSNREIKREVQRKEEARELYRLSQDGDDAKAAAKEWVYNLRIATNDDMPKSGQVLRLFTDESIAGSTPFEVVRQRAFAMLSSDRLASVAESMVSNAQFDETALQWEHLDKAAQRFKINLRPILQGVDFAASAADDPLIEAIQFLKQASREGKAIGTYKEDVLPVRWIPEKMKRYLYGRDQNNRKQLLTDRYEFLLYRHLRQGMEAGDVFCNTASVSAA